MNRFHALAATIHVVCGIAGMVRGEGARVDPDALRSLKEGILHRGPDGNGIWLNDRGNAALAHSRLAILDLSDAGAQPMQYEDLVITFNGEIYNYRELRAELESRGRTFRSTCDTEVLLQLYDEERERMLPRLRGMFAFTIWDEKSRTLFGARDLYGIKPLYYTSRDATFAFASLVEALAASGVVDRTPDLAAAAGFLLTGSVPEPRTHLRNVRALPAGSYFSLPEGGELRIRRWSSPSTLLASAPALREGTPAEVRHALLQSVRLHLVSDVPIVAFLSSGIDSSSLIALARDAGAGDLSSMTLAFDEFAGTDNDEAPLAEITARRLGIPHQTVRLTKKEFCAEMDTFLDRMDQPTIDGANSYFISRAAAAAGFKVALSGVGADELLGGYPSFRNIPRLVKASLPFAFVPAAGHRLRKIGTQIGASARGRKMLSTLAIGGSWPKAYVVQRQLFIEEQVLATLGNEVGQAALRELAYVAAVDDAIDPDPLDAFRRVSAMESSLYMKNQLLRDTDWASMTHPIEVRVPFAEAGLLSSLAPFLHGSGSKKHWLLESTAQPLPPQLATRRKTGFVVPLWDWMRAELGTRDVRDWAMFIFDRKFAGLRSTAKP